MGISRKPNRRYPSLPYVAGDLPNHTELLTTIRNALEIGQRRTADFPSSFVQIRDLIDIGLVDTNGNLNTDLISSNDGGSGGNTGVVETIVPGTGIGVNSTDPANPIVTNTGVRSVTNAGGIAVNNTDPMNPVVGINTSYAFTWLAHHLWEDGFYAAFGDYEDLRILYTGAAALIENNTGSMSIDTTADLSLIAASNLRLKIGANSALQINSSRAFGVGTVPDFGASGQILTSNGSAAPPSWTTPASGSANTLAVEIMADTPTGYWKFDEASGNFQDSSGNGYHLTTIVNTTYQASLLIPTLPTTLFARLNASSGEASRAGPNPLGISAPLVGDWSMSICVMSPNIQTNPLEMFRIGGTGETQVLNFQLDFAVATSGLLGCLWEFNAGTDVPNASTTTVLEAKAYHFALVKDGTANTLQFYVNGLPVSSVAYVNEPSGGTDAAVNFGFGATNAGNTSTYAVGHAAFYNGIKLSAARIAAHARAAGLFAN